MEMKIEKYIPNKTEQQKFLNNLTELIPIFTEFTPDLVADLLLTATMGGTLETMSPHNAYQSGIRDALTKIGELHAEIEENFGKKKSPLK